jgi:spermidine/putrescine transport system substrate-binding protein
MRNLPSSGQRHRSRWRPKTKLLTVVLVALAALVGFGCGESDDDSSQAETSGSTGGKPFAGEELVVMNWKGYGSDLPWAIEQFEEQTGATVEHQYKSSDQGALQTLRNGGVGNIDVAIANHAYVEPAVQSSLLEPIDVSKLKSYDRLSQTLRDVPSLRDGDDVYAVPWQWGLTTLAYNPEGTSGPVTGFDALWSEEYAGKVTFFDDPQTAVETAAFYLGEDPADPDLDAVEDALSELKDNAKVFWASADEWTRAFSSGQVVVGNAWSSLPAQLESPKIELVVPDSGSVGWLDSWTVVKDAPNPELAYAWINYMTSEAFQSRFSADPSHTAAGPANEAVLEQLPPAVVESLGVEPDFLPRLEFVAVTPEQLEEWALVWERVKAG